MAPETRLEVVNAAVAAIPAKMPDGPFQPTWASLQANYQVPQWLVEAKFGVFMHFGLYTVPAHHNEWYEQHMYSSGGEGQWHVDHYGPQENFGYKDFIPMFKIEKFDPDAWAELFKKSGAKFVVPTAEHHENFALWDSAVTPYNAKQMGPTRDLIGDLAKAVRAKGLKFGVSNHGIENFQFIHAPAEMLAGMKAKQTDLFDPKWVDFYNVADRSDAACEKFLVNWFERNAELIDKYQPDMLWFDNGVDIRYLDPLKLKVAAYNYNRSKTWGKEVTISTKKAAYAPGGNNTNTIGSVIDFEKIGARSPVRHPHRRLGGGRPHRQHLGLHHRHDRRQPRLHHFQARRHRQQKRHPAAQSLPQGRRHLPARPAKHPARRRPMARPQRRSHLRHS